MSQPAEIGIVGARGQHDRERAESIDRPSSDARSFNILLVDDRPELLASLAELVAAHGYDAVQSLGGRAALERFARGEEYDVILLDLIMPEVSGHDVLEYLARNDNPAKVIVVSGDASFDGVKHALACGAFSFIRKPYEAGELIATLNNALRSRELERSHREMEERLRDSEELHRYLVNSSPDLVYMLDRHGCFTFLNDRVETLLGFGKDELLGKHYSILVCEEDLNEARHLFNERRTGDRASQNVELRMRSRRSRHTTRPFETHAIWMELSAKGMYADATERNRDSSSPLARKRSR
jgi:PAS domain S-box-containing protein